MFLIQIDTLVLKIVISFSYIVVNVVNIVMSNDHIVVSYLNGS